MQAGVGGEAGRGQAGRWNAWNARLARSPRAGARDPVSGHSAWRHPFRVSQAKPHVSPRHPWIASFFISWCKIALIPHCSKPGHDTGLTATGWGVHISWNPASRVTQHPQRSYASHSGRSPQPKSALRWCNPGIYAGHASRRPTTPAGFSSAHSDLPDVSSRRRNIPARVAFSASPLSRCRLAGYSSRPGLDSHSHLSSPSMSSEEAWYSAEYRLQNNYRIHSTGSGSADRR